MRVGTSSTKGKSSRRPPISDKIVEVLKEKVEATAQISVPCLSQQSGVRIYHGIRVSKSKKFLFERISLAIQRGNAASIRGTFPDSALLSEIFALLCCYVIIFIYLSHLCCVCC
jgi:hypothetical protein